MVSREEADKIDQWLTNLNTEDVNTELRKLVKDLHTLAQDILPERKSDYITICSVESCIDYYLKTMPAIESRMRKLGIEVPE